MAEIHSLILKSDSTQIKKSATDLDTLSKSAGKAEDSNNKLSKSTNNTSESFNGMKTAIGSVISALGAGYIAKQYVDIADSMNMLDARLKMVSASTAEYESQQKQLLQISKESFSSISDITTLYTKLNPALKSIGGTTEDVNRVTESFSKALKLGGANTQEASSAILQFAQAMGSGVLRGEEFNAINEASPKIMQYLADGMGVPITAMRKMAEQGELTSGRVSAALLKMSGQINSDFGSIPQTVGMATTNLETDLATAIAQLDKTTGATKALAEMINDFSGDLSTYGKDIASFYQGTSKLIDDHNDGLRLTAGLVGGVAVAYYSFIAGGAVANGVRGITTSVFALRAAMIALQTSAPILLAISVALGIATTAYLAHDDALEKKNYSTINSIEALTKAHDALLKKRIEIQSDKFALDKTQKKETAIIDAELKKIENRLNSIGTQRSNAAIKIQEENKASIAAAKALEKASPKISSNKELLAQKKMEKQLEKEIADQRKKEHDKAQDELSGINRITKDQNDIKQKMWDDDQKAYEDNIKNMAQKKKDLIDYNQLMIELSGTESEIQEANIQKQVDLFKEQGRTQIEIDAYVSAARQKNVKKFEVALITSLDVATSAVYGLEDALVDMFMTGKLNAKDMFKSIMEDLIRMQIRASITAPLAGAISGFFGTAPVASANGNAFSGGNITAFATGGAFTNSIVDKPTTAPMALFGEAGPEAIMPLSRGAGGKLGINASGMGGGQDIKIEIINNSGEKVEVTESQTRFDGEQFVIGVVIDAVKRNKSGMRDIFQGGR